MIAFISGHLDLTPEEFVQHYVSKIDEAVDNGDSFVIGDARGTDSMAQKYLVSKSYLVNRIGSSITTVYHMFDSPRNCEFGLTTKGGYKTDEERDEAMTRASDYDIAWIRPGREKSGTAKNIKRRKTIIDGQRAMGVFI